MPQKLVPPIDDGISEEELEPVKENQIPVKQTPSKYSDLSVFPEGYVNPFDDKENTAPDGYPFIFSDADFELKRNPERFNEASKLKVTDEMRRTNSKTIANRIYQYDRWRIWKFTFEQKREQYMVRPFENDKPDARATVSINGVTWYILKGYDMYMPVNIKEMLMVADGAKTVDGRESLIASLSRKLDPETGLPKDPTRLER
ncbi:MAG: hypothetical protein KGJ07_09830 [Patescibacteria group bacterium]|nr:hypothetical protein [Patescibacteria group bacterium]